MLPFPCGVLAARETIAFHREYCSASHPTSPPPFGPPCYTVYRDKSSPACPLPSRFTTNREVNRPPLYQSPGRNTLSFLLLKHSRKEHPRERPIPHEGFQRLPCCHVQNPDTNGQRHAPGTQTRGSRKRAPRAYERPHNRRPNPGSQ